MADIAVIFAGGTGKRMNTRTKPKQFLELHNKPILVYTLEVFNNHPDIDGIILVILEDWIPYCQELVDRFRLTKVKAIVPGGDSALASQRNGLRKAAEIYPDDSVVLIHDGVRPFIDEETITMNIRSVRTKGATITVTPAIETIAVKNDYGEVGSIIERAKVDLVRAPQSFVLHDILDAHQRAENDGMDFIDSASMMQYYGQTLYTVNGATENIKITTPNDFYTFRALVDARENSQIFGI